MMIPKFRAWDKVDKKVRKVMSLDFYNTRQWEVTLASDGDVYLRYFEQIELMQYTGLKDKNGVEIFEGDIVKNTTQKVYSGQRYVVTWNEDWACYQLMENGLTSNIPLSQDFMSYEVIGNIYENPELLEV